MEGGRAVKKLSIAIVLLLFLAIFSFCLDFGGVLGATPIISHPPEDPFYLEANLSLWLSAQMGKNIDFLIQGSYTYSTENPYFFDLDFLKIEGTGISLFYFSLGRFRASDFSGYIIDHRIDGLSFGLSFPWGTISSVAGYSGLLFKESSAIIMSKGDVADLGDEDKILAAPRLAGGIDLLFPELFLRQDLNLSFWFQADLRPESEVVSEGTQLPSINGGKLHTQYTGLGLSGPLAPSLFYDGFAYLGTGKTLFFFDGAYEFANILSFLGSLGIRYYSEEWNFTKIALRCIYSSGDADYKNDFIEGNTDAAANLFIPVSRQNLALIFSPQLGNIFLTELSFSIKPLSRSGNRTLEKLQTELKVIGFFRSSTGLISEPGIDPASEALYLGTEIDCVINFRPFSDLGLSLSGGVFIPNTEADGAFLETEREVEVIGKAGFSFSF